MLLLFILFFLYQSSLQAYQSVPATNVKTFKISSPFLISDCQNSIWIYSKIEGTINKISTSAESKTETLKSFSISSPFSKNLTNLSCFENELIATMTLEKKSPQQQLFSLKLSSQGFFEIVKTHKVPSNGNIADLNCNSTKCFLLISGQLFESSQLESWKKTSIPSKDKIPHLNIDTKLNPFDDWNDKLTAFPGEFSRVQFLKNGGYSLLEPFATHIIVKNNSQFLRWGNWGAWEGFLMSPKAFDVTDEQIYLISDVALKLIFLFDENGYFLGSLVYNQELIELNHAIRLLWKKPFLYALDLTENKVLKIQLNIDKKTLLKEASENKTRLETKSDGDPGRINLYRRDFVLKNRLNQKCLSCHDGTISPSAQNFLPQLIHHPVDKEFKGKTDIPLAENKFVACTSCHDPHHGAGENVKMKMAPFLRKDPQQLCLSCHQDHQNESKVKENKLNHPQNKKSGCLDCHLSHGGFEKNIRLPQDQLCMNCHKPQKIEHPPLTNLLQTERAESLEFFENKISCQNCHSPHLEKHLKNTTFNSQTLDNLKKNLLKPYEKTLSFCASCHGEKTVNLFSQFHKHMGKKGIK
ncbi:MAG TPA: cytochrome c3 family protein [Pseudobdellovibrionaceae bacterium]|nr:cytochrome c3 family protein [Pseudobdellovibrionaceae bacterium]